MSNYQSSFHVVDLKLNIEPSLPAQVAQRSAQRARCTVHWSVGLWRHVGLFSTFENGYSCQLQASLRISMIKS